MFRFVYLSLGSQRRTSYIQDVYNVERRGQGVECRCDSRHTMHVLEYHNLFMIIVHHWSREFTFYESEYLVRPVAVHMYLD